MRKYIIPALVALTASAMVQAVQAQERDTRSAWAKSQDMYVEPTLRIRESTVVLTPSRPSNLMQAHNFQWVPIRLIQR